MISGPITSWQIDGEKVKTVADFMFLGSRITANGDCSHEIKRHLLLGKKAMTNLDKLIKKQRHHFANTDPYSQYYGFSRERNGTPLQYSCLENPRDGGAWWAAVYGVTQSQT